MSAPSREREALALIEERLKMAQNAACNCDILNGYLCGHHGMARQLKNDILAYGRAVRRADKEAVRDAFDDPSRNEWAVAAIEALEVRG